MQPHRKVAFHKSASVGYCPDFLDNDIDAIIEQLTVQPPPTDDEPNQTLTDNQQLEGSSREKRGDSTNIEKRELSKTLDLGSLGMEEEFNSLVIPPPPEETFSINDQDIAIVPPIESVRDRKKMFEKPDSEGYVKNFGKNDKVTSALTDTKTKSVLTSEGSKINTVMSKGSEVKKKEKLNEVKKEEKDGSKAHEAQNDTSPGSVSEKLNALLKSLSTYQQEDEEALGTFRRTSSLRLGRCSSLDFLNNPKALENAGKNNDLVTGSVRVRPRVRPKLNIDRPFVEGSGHVAVPLKTNSLDRVSNNENKVSDQNESRVTVNPSFQRTQSVDVLPTGKSDKSDNDNSVSESFASLKAKLQSYRDSLLNRSIRRKKKLEAGKDSTVDDTAKTYEDGGVQRKGSLTRSNSFSSLIRRSLGRSAGKEVKEKMEAAASSEVQAVVGNDAKEEIKLGGKEKKYWNTLTTPRSTFRPNVGPNQSQVSINKNISFFFLTYRYLLITVLVTKHQHMIDC